MSVYLLRRAAVGIVAGAVGIAALLAVGLTAPPAARAANPTIFVILFANGHTVTTTTIDLTVGGVVQGNILGGVSNASPQASGTMLVASLPDDASFTYTCDGGPSTTFNIPTPSLALRAKYKLTCPSPGGTVTASAPTAPGPGDASFAISPPPTGGVAEVPSGGSPPLSATATAGGSGLPMGAWAGVLGAITVGIAVLGGGALYLRKRA